MLFLLSPAKSLDYESPLPPDVAALAHSLPAFIPQSAELMALLRQLAPQDLAKLMGISDKLAQLNAARNAAWSTDFSADNARAALFAFNGDVYEGLDAYRLNAQQVTWANEHLIMLSGLYGVLRPLDWMQPYRLEMGSKLANPLGSNLYAYWGSRIADYLNQRQQDDSQPVVVNLASQEYFKAVDTRTLRAQVVECVFQDYKNGAYKIISFYAKRARGLMARWAIEQQANRPQDLQDFNLEGYAYASAASSAQRLVFQRQQAA